MKFLANMELITIKGHIEGIIAEIGGYRKQLGAKGEAKAKAISDYDRKLAITLATLRHDESYTLAGKTYNSPPVSIIEKLAKGICSEEAYKREVAESDYKAVMSNMQALMAQLNAYQSILRYLDE